MPDILLLDSALLTPVIDSARAHPRRRMNRNLHARMEAPCQRFFNAIEPDSYVMPHRHLAADKEETMVVVRGALAVLHFDDDGAITATHTLRAGGDAFGAHILPGTWHSVVALESGTVFLEAKTGPYRPLSIDEIPDWAPREGAPDCVAFLQRMHAAALGMPDR